MNDRALMQYCDTVGEVLGFIEILGREQHRSATIGELFDGPPHLDTRLGVEPRRRFVEEDNRWITDQAHGDVETAPHSTRVRRHFTYPGFGERESREHVVGDVTRTLQVTQPGDKNEVLAAGEHLVDRSELAGQADRLAHVAGLRSHVEPVDRGAARVGLEKRRQDSHDRGLARAVRAEQREDGSWRDLEIDSLQHVLVLERLLEAPHPNGRAIRRSDRHDSCPSIARSMASASRVRSLRIQLPPA